MSPSTDKELVEAWKTARTRILRDLYAELTFVGYDGRPVINLNWLGAVRRDEPPARRAAPEKEDYEAHPTSEGKRPCNQADDRELDQFQIRHRALRKACKDNFEKCRHLLRDCWEARKDQTVLIDVKMIEDAEDAYAQVLFGLGARVCVLLLTPECSGSEHSLCKPVAFTESP